MIWLKIGLSVLSLLITLIAGSALITAESLDRAGADGGGVVESNQPPAVPG